MWQENPFYKPSPFLTISTRQPTYERAEPLLQKSFVSPRLETYSTAPFTLAFPPSSVVENARLDQLKLNNPFYKPISSLSNIPAQDYETVPEFQNKDNLRSIEKRISQVQNPFEKGRLVSQTDLILGQVIDNIYSPSPQPQTYNKGPTNTAEQSYRPQKPQLYPNGSIGLPPKGMTQSVPARLKQTASKKQDNKEGSKRVPEVLSVQQHGDVEDHEFLKGLLTPVQNSVIEDPFVVPLEKQDPIANPFQQLSGIQSKGVNNPPSRLVLEGQEYTLLTVKNRAYAW